MTDTGLPGSTLGGYAVEALLGSGGMASVYRGLDLHLQRPVAIKVLSDRAAALPGFAERFRQEARLVANLRHPNIVQIYAFGEERGLTYMVQELLPGPTLEQRMADIAAAGASFSSDEVMAIVGQLAAALDAAHAAGVIHRDVKPANALWNAAGALVLTDFGIAKELGGAVGHTQAGVVIGTPTYMAPEQAQGQPLTAAADVYALGVMLYALLTGQVPFAASDPLAVLLQHIQSPPPPPRALRPDLPPAVEAVVLRALAKDPRARHPSAGALAGALRQAWTGPVAAGDIHQIPTQRWAPALTGRPPSPPAQGGPPAFGPGPAAPVTQRAPAARRPSRLLPALGALLLLAFVGAALMVARGGAVAEAPATGEPAASPGDTPAQGAPAAPQDGPVAATRELLAAGARDGSAGPQGEALVAAFDAARQAIDQGDSAGATARLAALQRALLEEARAGTLDPDLLRRALSGIDAVAAESRLDLPLAVR